MNKTDLREDIQAALAAIPSSDFLAAAKDLLEVLGYQSDRTQELSGSVNDFIQEFPAYIQKNTQTSRAFRKHVRSVRLVFQVTSDEIASVDQPTLGFEADSFDKGQQQSFMFFTVELKEPNYARGQYAQFTQPSFCSEPLTIGSLCPLSIAANTSAIQGVTCWAMCL